MAPGGSSGPRIPRPLQPVVGDAALVGMVRAIDAVWSRVVGRRPPRRDAEATVQSDAAPAVVRDRLVYALLLGGVLRLATRVGMRSTEDGSGGETRPQTHPEAHPDM